MRKQVWKQAKNQLVSEKTKNQVWSCVENSVFFVLFPNNKKSNAARAHFRRRVLANVTFWAVAMGGEVQDDMIQQMATFSGLKKILPLTNVTFSTTTHRQEGKGPTNDSEHRNEYIIEQAVSITDLLYRQETKWAKTTVAEVTIETT